MKKIREVSLSDMLDNIPVEEDLETRMRKDIPIGKPFTIGVLCDYYKCNRNSFYGIIYNWLDWGIVTKKKGKFANRNSVDVYTRIK